MTDNFGSGKNYIPSTIECGPAPSFAPIDFGPTERVQAQGVFDIFKLMDGETIDKIKAIVASVDPNKIKSVMDMIEVDEEGWTKIKIDLRIRK